MWNTVECKRDSLSGALGGARDTPDVFHVTLKVKGNFEVFFVN